MTDIPTGKDVELAASTLRTEAAKLARYEGTQDGVAVWTAPGGEGPPGPGAVESALALLRVAVTLESLQDPLDRFSQATEAGLSPMDFLLGMMAETTE